MIRYFAIFAKKLESQEKDSFFQFLIMVPHEHLPEPAIEDFEVPQIPAKEYYY